MGFTQRLHFIAVDTSSSRRAERRAFVMELKMGERLVMGGARLECAQYRHAVDELVAREVLALRSLVELLYGDGAVMLTHVGA